MRVTEGMRLSYAVAAAAKQSERLAELTQEATTGQRVQGPSDDPAAYASIVSLDARIGHLHARADALSRTQADLELSEGPLASASDLLVRAREIALQMSTGTVSASARADAAQEVAELRQAMLAAANTKGSRGYLFGGSVDAAQPFDAAGVFTGNDTALGVEIAEGSTTRSNASGAMAFTNAGGRDVFADLTALETALGANDVAGLQGLLDPLEADHAQVVAERGRTGLHLDSIRTAQGVASTTIDLLHKARAVDSDADAIATFSTLSEAQAAYERSLEVTRRILSSFTSLS